MKHGFTKLNTASFPVRAALLAALFLCLAIGALSYIVNVSATRENAINQVNAQKLAVTALTALEENTADWAKDYAWWDDTLKQVDNLDLEWAEANIGNYLHEAFGISRTFLLNPARGTIFVSPRNGPVAADAMAFLGPNGAAFLDDTQATNMAESIPLTTYVVFDDKVYLVAAAAVTAESPSPAQLKRAPRPTLILAKELDAATIQDMSTQYLLPKLRLLRSDVDVPSDALALKNPVGDVVARLAWTPIRSGDRLIDDLLPRILVVVAFLIGIALILVFFWWRTTEALSAAKSQFLAKMSHELRTPLNPILGFSEIMADETLGPLPANYKEYARDIHVSGRHLSSIVEDVLDVSRIAAGQFQLHETEIDLDELIRNLPPLSQGLTPRDTGPAARVDIVTEIEPGLPSLRGDTIRVRQILLNLLSNAVKYSNGAPVTLRAFRTSDALAIQIADQGIGIAANDLEQLFTPFVQVGDAGRANRPQGTGLGLVVCKELMEQHGGTLTIDSTPDEGTTVTLIFPPSRVIVKPAV